MKIAKIKIYNIKSFNNTTIEFDKNLNILIGPNGGGKSNLLDILTIVLKYFFFVDYRIERANTKTNIKKKRSFENTQLLDEMLKGNFSIEISFEVTQEDVNNLKIIKENRLKFMNRFYSYDSKPLLDTKFDNLFKSNVMLETGEYFTYRFDSTNINRGDIKPKERYFWNYLETYGLFVLLSRDMEDINLSSQYLYFPPHRESQSNSQISTSDNFYDSLIDYSLSTSKRTISLIKASSTYFMEKIIKYQQEAKYEGWLEKYNNDPEVRLVTEYLSKLGYSWDMEHVNHNSYRLILNKGEIKFTIDQSSSGETEILNFLLGIFAFNIKNGIILIDEPELHLHPTWQSVLMDLFKDLAERTGNQFILATHSTIFVNDRTINNVIRVYSGDEGNSKLVKFDKNSIVNSKDILHIINSHNNEKMFFADKVVLVEGIKDRVVIETLIQISENKSDIIEVLEVHGKHNFDKYRLFLDSFNIKNYIISDLDYILDVCDNNSIKALFETNYKNIDSDIFKRCKKSLDCKTLSRCLENAIETESLEDLKLFWTYLNSRFIKLKSNLDEAGEDLINLYIDSKYSENLFILKKGEIEYYLPENQKSLENTIKLMKQSNIGSWLDEEKVDELLKIVKCIIND